MSEKMKAWFRSVGRKVIFEDGEVIKNFDGKVIDVLPKNIDTFRVHNQLVKLVAAFLGVSEELILTGETEKIRNSQQTEAAKQKEQR